MARPALELSSVARRWGAGRIKAQRTLADVLQVAARAEPAPRAAPDTETRDLSPHVDTTAVGPRRVADDWRLETFVISKRPGEAYFRSNPEWIAKYVVMKFRTLLIRMKDEALCIDYDMLQKKRHTLPYQGNKVRSDDERLQSSKSMTLRRAVDRAHDGQHDRVQQAMAQYSDTGQTVGGAGGGAMLPKKQHNGKKISRNQYLRAKYHTLHSTNRADRRAIIRTLTQFPFPSLKAHGEGHIRFLDALRYFQRELKCEVVRQWTEDAPEGSADGKDQRSDADRWRRDDGAPAAVKSAHEDALFGDDPEAAGVTFLAELRVPEFSGHGAGMLAKWLDPAWRQREKQTTNATRVLCHWLGDSLQPFDENFGNIRRGMQWQGGGANGTDLFRTAPDWAGFGRLTRANRPHWFTRVPSNKKWTNFVSVKHRLVGPRGFAHVGNDEMSHMPHHINDGVLSAGTFRDL